MSNNIPIHLPRGSSDEEDDAFLGKSSAWLLDVLWCYSRIDDPDANTGTAPSVGAWNLLLWAREERDHFYETALPRALTSKAMVEPQQSELSGWDLYDDVDEADEGDDLFDILDPSYNNPAFVDGAPPRLVADAESMVREWAAEFGVTMPKKELQSLCYLLGGIVDECAIAAAANPEAFGGATRG
jgi:hypothetical protein